MPFTISTGAIAAFFQVVMIDLALAGDNAVAVGLAASGLPPHQRRRAIVLGLGAAVVMLVGFALITTQLLKVVGLLLAGGLLLSITLMGVAATWIAKLLHSFRWLGYLGLVIVLVVAARMIWEGSRNVAIDLGRVEAFNRYAPQVLDIGPDEIAKHKKRGH